MFQNVFMDPPKILKYIYISMFFGIFMSFQKIEYLWMKAHYIVHKMLSQGNFCKILGLVIGHVIKYNQLK
jgi:hypothetical protein